MDEYLWPARNVAEYAYCPRLFYYMEVEGIHLPSDDTEQGQRIHRRVDQPSKSPDSDSQDVCQPKSLRSLTLTSRRLGLTATLDLAEINGDTAIPIEYRIRMQTELEEAMNLKEDQVMIIDLGANEDVARRTTTFLGPAVEQNDRGIVVV